MQWWFIPIALAMRKGPGSCFRRMDKQQASWPPSHYDIFLNRSTTIPVTPPYMASFRTTQHVLPTGVRQLFFDDKFVHSSSSVGRVWHKASFLGYPTLPKSFVLYGSAPWEIGVDDLGNERTGRPMTSGSVAIPYSGGVAFDEHEGVFKLFYKCGSHAIWDPLCMALSPNGLDWRKDIGMADGTNIVLNETHDSAAVILDERVPPDQLCRFKLVQYSRSYFKGTKFGYFCSACGRRWTYMQELGRAGDRSSVFFNPHRNTFVFLIRENLGELWKERVVRYWEAPLSEKPTCIWDMHPSNDYAHRAWKPGQPFKLLGV